MIRRAVWLALFMLLAACKSAKPAPESQTPPVKVEPVRVQQNTGPAPLPVVAEREVVSLLERWRDAQIRGDFTAYEQQYASKFFGVKRVGTRAQRFDRAGWLVDRERMFKAPMQVEVRDPKIQVAAGSAVLVFTQRWSSGAFEDLGQKRMLILLEKGELKIAQEEMLDSRPLAFSGKLRAAAEGFHFVMEFKSGLYIPTFEKCLGLRERVCRRPLWWPDHLGCLRATWEQAPQVDGRYKRKRGHRCI